jgi:hypothetical protein
MKLRKIFTAFLLLSLLGACKSIIYTIHDVRQVRPQSNDDLIDFCLQKQIDTKLLKRVKQEALDSNLRKHLNQHYLFDSSGQMVNYATSFENPRCKGNLLQLIKSPDTLNSLPRNATITLESILSQTLEVNQLPISTGANIPATYTIVMFWNTFSGNPNHKKAFSDLNEAIKGAPYGMFRLLLINQDFHPGSIPSIQMK